MSKTQRDLKHDRGVWNSNAVITEINLLSDAIIDKITSLYCLVIKNNRDQPTFEIKNALLGIVNHLSANEINCHQMHVFCKDVGRQTDSAAPYFEILVRYTYYIVL